MRGRRRLASGADVSPALTPRKRRIPAQEEEEVGGSGGGDQCSLSDGISGLRQVELIVGVGGDDDDDSAPSKMCPPPTPELSSGSKRVHT